MQYQIQGQPYPVVVLTVEPEETVLCQKGAMAWMTPNMEMQTKGGGLGKMFSRAFTGESMFQNHYTAKGGRTGHDRLCFRSAGRDHAGADLAGAFHCGTEVCLSGFGSRC